MICNNNKYNITLKESGVTFCEFDHTYVDANGNSLNGITGMISSQLFPDMYSTPKGYTEDEWNAIITAKAQWGTERHHEMEQFFNEIMIDGLSAVDADIVDCFTSDMTDFRKRFDCIGTASAVATEYNVRIGETHCSNIDLVMAVGERKVVLIDYKTYYKFDKQHKDYATWQLSLYKLGFEQLNPDIEVVGIAVYHFNKQGEHGFYYFNHIDKDECIDLVYSEESGLQYESTKLIHVGETDMLPQENLDKIAKFLELKKQVEAMQKQLSAMALEFLKQGNVIDNDKFCVSYVKPSKRKSLDTKGLQEKYPEIYAEFIKESEVGESVKFKLK